ncbi:radical SAM protein [Helicobacter sp. 11S02629-2]|uniref:radical SAM protein n=1 Tax=Helicobacter sp. 11S02629-2 TaxID=1476195 RepID=UPI000BA63384|nr:radical SAM protein [Helicobacter sp. 11S02629-2]PAF45589.1 radical SAM protein [Helicobacter sp. 11S02629-2]
MQVVFGPILSRRFGVSLGVDLSPNKKQCNFDCVYCELTKSKTLEIMQDIVPLDTVLDSVREALKQDSKIDVLTFSANGEPTLYPYLYELIVKTKEILKPYPHIKTLILSNGSRFWDEDVRKALNEFDMVKFSCDSLNPKSFKKVDRPDGSLSLDSIKQGIKEFSLSYKGALIAEVLFVKDINDSIEDAKSIALFLKEVNIARVDLSTIDRPSSYAVKPIDYESLVSLSSAFCGLNVCIAKRVPLDYKHEKMHLDENGILELLARRPLSIEDAKTLLDESTFKLLDSMKEAKKIKVQRVGILDFFKPL